MKQCNNPDQYAARITTADEDLLQFLKKLRTSTRTGTKCYAENDDTSHGLHSNGSDEVAEEATKVPPPFATKRLKQSDGNGLGESREDFEYESGNFHSSWNTQRSINLLDTQLDRFEPRNDEHS